MESSKTRMKIYDFFSALSDREREEAIDFLDSITEIADLIQSLRKKESQAIGDEMRNSDPFLEKEVKRVEKILSDRNRFPSNRYLIDFIKLHFRQVIGSIDLEKRSRKEISQKLCSRFRNQHPSSSISVLIEKLCQGQGQNDYNELFQAITKPK